MKCWMQIAVLVTWTVTICILVRRIPEEGQSAMTLIDSNLASNLVQKIETVLSENEHLKAAIFDEIRRIKHKLDKIQDGDGRDKRKWAIMNELGQKVQRRFAYIQNPRNCRTARKYICSPKSCGYGCQLHHMAYCLIMAYASNRTLVVNLEKNTQSWTPFFKPLSETCLKSYDENHVVQWNELNDISQEGGPDHMEILLPVLDNIGFHPDYLPLAIPADLAPTLQRFHGNPIVWWIGQVAKYLTRFNADTERDLEEYEKKIKFRGPIVGVHVRRTDKLTQEAALHYLDEYMVYVEDYFNGLDIQTGSKVERKVYLATDEPTVIKESKKYKDYTFIYNIDIIRTAERVTGSSAVMMGIVYDIHFLSKTDFLVCTFSSQVCRTAYELMQTKHVDASSNFRSLDDVYYYGGQGPHRMTAVEDHEALSKEELNVVKGSDVYIAGNTWTGDVVVRNHGETRNALVPAYKVEDIVETAQCPLYEEVDLVGS
ncbi:alpha-(1,6)-fucosyltransferase-like isoform X2 [Haliotis rubra]|uniref:alpha-(1,6)-fucosyltransferase-like isoform X2 n=1 Tax=Haliotis rubra TaxID=36100 RepID=UPI001EE601E9|nr:alpha-(1,6)-fucosyltransferase-like isoform X2 [Haliotis rubra]